ncbi:immunoglobulin-like domain-containing protein [Ureibacillus endophyticus]|uniref:immunoglobulin-like domain-containing protein n=1 Tax=Ureibacillus endophyticus TaxID=1978490 RepID=UPI00319D9CA5
MVRTGAVTLNRPAVGQSDVEVTLTATVNDVVTATKQFIVTVKAQTETAAQKAERLATALTDEALGLQNGEPKSAIETTPQLATTAGEDSTIVWTSNNAAITIDSETGAVTLNRPAVGQSDVEVTLTATVNGVVTATKQFTVKVKARTETAAQKAERLVTALTDEALGLQNGEPKTAIETTPQLATTAGEASTIVWTSNNAAITIDSETGAVTLNRPAVGQSDVEVTLTATVNGVVTATKQFTVKVKALSSYTDKTNQITFSKVTLDSQTQTLLISGITNYETGSTFDFSKLIYSNGVTDEYQLKGIYKLELTLEDVNEAGEYFFGYDTLTIKLTDDDFIEIINLDFYNTDIIKALLGWNVNLSNNPAAEVNVNVDIIN